MKEFIPRRRAKKPSEVWQIIYMDLMTIIMVFFVILWSLNQGTDVGATDAIGDQTTRMLSLPADVLFPVGKAKLSAQGEEVFKKLFDDPTGAVLDFDTGGLTKRLLVVHGHTDADGEKQKNFQLGFERAYAAYEAVASYSDEVSDHVVLCSHADNSPVQDTPQFQGDVTQAQRAALQDAKAKNRRIEIEDKIVSVRKEQP